MHARRERLRLGKPPRRREPVGRRVLGALVGEQQLDNRRAKRRIRAPRSQRPEPLAERARERGVERLDQLRAGAEVDVEGGARPDRCEPLPESLEQLDVGMPEAVDRLLGVADGEEIAHRDGLDQLELHDVRVLKLVNHDVSEPRAVALTHLRLSQQQLPGPQFEILEVEARYGPLALLDVLAERPQQPIEQCPRRNRPMVPAGVAVAAERLCVGLAHLGAQRGTVAPGKRQPVELPRPRVGEGEHAVAPLEPLNRQPHPGRRRRDRPELTRRRGGGRRELLTQRLELGGPCDRRQRRQPLTASAQLGGQVPRIPSRRPVRWAAISSTPPGTF